MSAIHLLIVVLAAVYIDATETCTRKLDLSIGVEASTINCGATEQCPEWNAVLQFCKNLVNSLTIGPGDTRVAFITVADAFRVEWGFGEYTDKNALLSAIGRVAYRQGEITNFLSSGIFFTDIFKMGAGDRLDVPNVAFGILDGLPLGLFDAALVLSNALQKIGTKVILVCVTSGCNESFVKGVVSDPKQANVTYFFAENFLSIDDVTETLVKQICSYGQTKLF